MFNVREYGGCSAETRRDSPYSHILFLLLPDSAHPKSAVNLMRTKCIWHPRMRAIVRGEHENIAFLCGCILWFAVQNTQIIYEQRKSNTHSRFCVL